VENCLYLFYGITFVRYLRVAIIKFTGITACTGVEFIYTAV